MAKDAKGHGSDARGGVQSRLEAARQNPNHPLGALTRAVSGSGGPFIGEQPAHGQGVAQVGQTPLDPLQGMTGQKWDSMSPAERDRVRDNSGLTPQLKGLEGHRVQVTDHGTNESRRFIVGKSTGWRPAHLEIKTTRSMGGGTASSKGYASVRDLGKVR